MGQPNISVITPAYNRADLIAATIQSVQQQTLKEWEMIIVDDHSTDETPSVAMRFAENDPRIRFVHRKSDRKGASVCRNEGTRYADGEYVVFLDSDDLLTPTCLERRLAVMKENDELDAAVFQGELFNHAPGDMGVCVNNLDCDNDLEHFLIGDGLWLVTSPIWKRNVFYELGGWDESLSCYQDWELAVRSILNAIRYTKIDVVDVYFRQSQNSRDCISGQVESCSYTLNCIMAIETVFHQLNPKSDEFVEQRESLRFLICEQLAKLCCKHQRYVAIRTASRLSQKRIFDLKDVLFVWALTIVESLVARLSYASEALRARRFPRQRELSAQGARYRWPAQ